MKNLRLTTLLMLITLGLSSCSVEEDLTIQDEMSGKLFEKVAVKRNIDGSYYLDMEISDGAGVDILNNAKSNSTDLNFYPSDQATRRSLNENLYFGDEGSFRLRVNNTVENRKNTITVIDNDIKFNKLSEEEEDHLVNYSFTDNGDKTYDLDFEVDDNIATDFVYNENTKVYEIHLEPGVSSQSEFLRTFTKKDGENLEIVFVNYFQKKSTLTSSKKPRIIIGND